MARFGQGDQLTQRQILLDGFFDEEGSPARDALFGLGGVVLGGMALRSGLTGGINTDKVSVGLLSSGGGLALTRNDNARMIGRGLIMTGIVYEAAVRAGLLDRFLS